MKNILVSLLTTTTLLISQNITSLTAKFSQTIVTDDGSNIYSGDLYIRGGSILWAYSKPVKKNIYINHNKIVIIEPDLEQATIAKMGENINFLKILNKTVKSKSKTYSGELKDGTKYLFSKNKTGYMVSYKNSIGDRESVQFSNIVFNKKIARNKLTPVIPHNYDILKK